MTTTGPDAQERPDEQFDEQPDQARNEQLDEQFGEQPNEQADERRDDVRPDDFGGRQDSSAAGSSDDAPVRLLQADELQAVVSKWREIQAEFVDQPKRAMQEADELVSELMERLSRTFAEQREQLESRWSDSDRVSTEELRQGLQRYRSFFERLLAA